MPGRGKATHSGALLALGYGLYAWANASSYLSASGTVEASLGFVSQLPYMMANCAAQAAAALAVVLLARRGRLAPGRLLPPSVGCCVLLASWAAGLLWSAQLGPAAPAGASSDAARVALGLVHGAGSTLGSVAWYELLAVYAAPSVPAVMLPAAALHAAIGLALGALPAAAAPAARLAMPALLLASWALARRVRATARPAADPGEFNGRVELFRGPGRGFLSAWLCLLVCQFVVGVANTAVFESPFSSVLASVSVDACTLFATAVLAALFVAARRLPEPESVFKVVMPVLLAAFTATALASGGHGAAMGYAMICCYEAIAVSYSIYLVQFVRRGRYGLHAFIAVTMAAASLTLLLGLAVGVGLNAVSHSRGVPLFTLLAFVAIYPLGMALAFIQRARPQPAHPDGAGAPAGAGQAVAPAPAEAAQAAFESRLKAFAREHGLTPREAEVCGPLVRGHTVKSVCASLAISENTAWTHIRSIYAKCGVNSKQALIELFEQGGRP